MMKLSSQPNPFGLPICLLVGLATAELAVALSTSSRSSFSTSQHHRSSHYRSSTPSHNTESLHSRLLDRCCRIGTEKALESASFSCKMSPTEALGMATRLTLGAELLAQDQDLGDQCQLVLESCCIAENRKRNCDSGKQFAKSGSACMDVELSKDVTIATESFNDCCMSCSLGILAARTSKQQHGNESSLLTDRCKLMNPLASSLSGQLYEQTYIECCQENLPRQSGALTEPGQPIDCVKSNPCTQRCVQSSLQTGRCECFTGYKLASDGLNCVDIDECKLNQHSCDRKSEICDNIPGGFRCLARAHTSQSEPTDKTQWRSMFDSQTDWDTQSKGAQQFVAMRLCPLNSRWNPQEHRCDPTTVDHHHHNSRLISSLLA